jgi:hypothetical protein
MNDTPPTYTRLEAMAALGIKSPSTFHHLRRKYPQAFMVVRQGLGRTHLTLYDKATLDQFIVWRQLSKTFSAIINDPLAIFLPKKGKQS